MALIHSSNSPQICSFHGKPISRNFVLPPLSLSFPLYSTRLPVNFAAKTEPDGGGEGRSSTEAIAYGSHRKRAGSPAADEGPDKEYSDDTSDKKADGDGDTWVDWEDKILEDTVPLVGFVRMILHSGRYESGDRLSPEHEKTILERLLAYHPEYAKKIGCGVDYITVASSSHLCVFAVPKYILLAFCVIGVCQISRAKVTITNNDIYFSISIWRNSLNLDDVIFPKKQSYKLFI